MEHKFIGHNKQRKILTEMRKGSPPHALIFSGPEYIGKKLAAKIFFGLLSNPKATWEAFLNTDNDPDRRIRNESHPDILIIGENKNITIKQVREIRRFVGLSPLELKKKLVLIDNAESLLDKGFNTLLKTFEEPAGDTLIILVTSRHEMLPKTITSRAMTIPFSKVNDKTLLDSLSTKEREVIKREASWLAGRPGLMYRYLQNSKDPVVAMRKKYYAAFNNALSVGGVAVRLTLAEEAAKSEYPLRALEAFVLAARNGLSTTKAPHAAVRLHHLKGAIEHIRFTNANTRLTLESALLTTRRPSTY